jgi:hypothetical protein
LAIQGGVDQGLEAVVEHRIERDASGGLVSDIES